jgi:hypothetical protein
MKRLRAVVIPAALLALLSGWACGPKGPADPMQAQAREYGIEILGVEFLAGGDFVRLNYKVVDYEKAKRAMQAEVNLVPEGSSQPLPVASTGRLGPLRQRPSSTGRPQFMLFTNYARTLVKGGRATLKIGDRGISGIPVS